MNEEEIQSIVDKKSRNQTLDASEEQIFEEWIAIPGNQAKYREQYKLLRLLMAANAWLAKPDVNQFRKEKKRSGKPVYICAMAYAAGILLFGFIVSPFFFRFDGEQTGEGIEGAGKEVILKFASGESLSLEEEQVGVLKENNRFKVTKDNWNQLSYFTKQNISPKEADQKPEYNTLVVPRGKDYHLTLADGTEVWLNSASELTFPVAFGTGARSIHLKGEGYFQVVSDSTRPFIVNTDDFSVRVTGTHFNVCRYPERNEVTLVEGIVEVARGEMTKKLNPGQQAILLPEGITTREVDTDTYIAWMNGCFRYQNTDLRRIMEDVARWYDLDIKYMDEKTRDLHFSTAFNRELPLDDVLALLEKTEKIVFIKKEKALFIHKGIAE